jgi:NADH:ubiquinone oxidoreductase subunit H
MLGVLLRIAFFTLIERKIIGISHYRKGPNKIILIGILQPIRDAIKLITKENFKIQTVKIIIFLIGPVLIIFLIILCWG